MAGNTISSPVVGILIGVVLEGSVASDFGIGFKSVTVCYVRAVIFVSL